MQDSAYQLGMRTDITTGACTTATGQAKANDDVGPNDFRIEGKIHGKDTHKGDGVMSGDVR